MTPFSTFGLLYMTALFLELAERWTFPAFTLVTLLLVALFLWTGITRVTFLIFLVVTTSHFLLVQFPDVANHVNVAIYCNVLMVAAIVYSSAERNSFFSIPVGIVRRRANLGPPLPGQPGPFSLGGDGALAGAYTKAGFHDVKIRVVSAPLRLPKAADYVRFARESFGALHEMMTNLSEKEKEETWQEIETALKKYEGPN